MCAKETVMQFGEGGFLRGFVDYFFHKLREKGLYDGKIVIVQPIEKGMVDVLAGQGCEYNLYLRGIQNGEEVVEHTHVTSISRAINPYKDYEDFIALADNPDLRVIVSNTTEAGIEYIGTESFSDKPPKAYPAKLTQFLYRRYKNGLKGFILLPCELIDANADNLKACILKYADLWELGEDFKTWVVEENSFNNTLVDRICTGYPRAEAADICKELGYTDNLIDTAEIFHLWVIEGHHEDELPFQTAGYNIVWTDDVKPYKKRKVRILNGGHTSMVLGAYLYGLETVGECMKDPVVSAFLKKCLFEEIVPTLGGSEVDKKFAEDVLERFSNPFIKHMLLSIALNSVSKFQVRVLPTILEYKEKYGKYPEALTFSLAALIAFYRTDKANDAPEIMEYMKSAPVADILKREDYWHADLSEMIPLVEGYYNLIQEKGMKEAYGVILG